MGPYQDDEFQEMFNLITINETSFFRNEPQLQVFETVMLPKILQSRQSSKRLRIWSCACSSGEEPYTLAILLHRSLGIRLMDWHIQILGRPPWFQDHRVCQRLHQSTTPRTTQVQRSETERLPGGRISS